MLRMARVAERGGGKGGLRAEACAMLGTRLVLNQEIRKAGIVCWGCCARKHARCGGCDWLF